MGRIYECRSQPAILLHLITDVLLPFMHDQAFFYQTKRKQHCVASSDIDDIISMFDGSNDTFLGMTSQSGYADHCSIPFNWCKAPHLSMQ